ncbi:MAG: glycosyltransferase [Flavobacteriales bacterium]|nr:glycosyltransferase [Flavobacteriales bacterium]
MKLSVIIVNYNVKYFLEQCLISVFKAMEGIDGEVWVVDNNSADASMEMVHRLFPQVRCIENKDNVGFSKANNQAMLQSSGEYILLLNPDTVVEEDTFHKCLQYMDDHPDVGGLGVKMIDGKGQYLPESKRGLPTPEVALYKMIGLNKLFPKSRRFGKYHMGFVGENETAAVDVLAGAYMWMRKSVLDEVGLLDETFFMYGEDIDLSYRITQGGYQNVYFPETSIIHYKGESTKKMTVNYVFIFYKAMVIFARKHYKGRHARTFIFLINLAIYGRAALAVVQRMVSKSWLFVVDLILVLGGLFLIKEYWEEHIKEFDTFPDELVYIHFPYYTFLWLVSVYLSGGYRKPWSTNRIIRGVLIGSVLISAVYGLLPNHLRYSRGIIIAGSAWAMFALITVRILVQSLSQRRLSFSSEATHNVVIVGHAQERNRVRSIMDRSEVPMNFLGFVALEDEPNHGDVLGKMDRLDELCRLYDVNEVIFCARDVSNSDTMRWMKQMGSDNIHFKIVPDERYFIIGSNSKDINGELYTEEIRFALADAEIRRNKRLLDVILCLILLIPGLLIGWMNDGIIRYYQNLMQVFWGKKTWVSYDHSVSVDHLPELADGVYSTSDVRHEDSLSEEMRQKLNFFYAKNYSYESDVNRVLKALFTRIK